MNDNAIPEAVPMPEVEPQPQTPAPKKRGRKPRAESEATAIVPVVETPKLSLQGTPEMVLEEASKAAKALQQVIESSPEPPVSIRGKRYLKYEHWQTVARFFACTARETSSSYITHGGTPGYEAAAEVLMISTNQVIGHADAQCMEDESEWARKPLFQLRSMAQTRACAKALRSVFSWVVVLAGYSATPAEEMPDSIEQMIEKMPAPPPPAPRLRAGNAPQPEPGNGAQANTELQTHIESIQGAANLADLQKRFITSYRMLVNRPDQLRQITMAKDRMKAKFMEQLNRGAN